MCPVTLKHIKNSTKNENNFVDEHEYWIILKSEVIFRDWIYFWLISARTAKVKISKSDFTF